MLFRGSSGVVTKVLKVGNASGTLVYHVIVGGNLSEIFSFDFHLFNRIQLTLRLLYPESFSLEEFCC